MSQRLNCPGDVGAFELKSKPLMVAISGAVCGSRLLHHFGQRHDFWRDYAWGIAMVKSGSPPGWVDPGQRELIPIVPLALRPNPS